MYYSKFNSLEMHTGADTPAFQCMGQGLTRAQASMYF